MRASRLWSFGVTVAVALFAVWALGRASASQAERDSIAAQAQGNAQVAHRAYREARKRVAPALAVTDRVTRIVQVRDTALGAQLDTARAVLADTAATLVDVRETLAATVVEAEAFRVAVDSLTVAHAAERRVLLAALTSADVALDAEQRVSRAYKLASRCRVLGLIPCPTRTQTAVGAVLVTVAAFVAVR